MPELTPHSYSFARAIELFAAEQLQPNPLIRSIYRGEYMYSVEFKDKRAIGIHLPTVDTDPTIYGCDFTFGIERSDVQWGRVAQDKIPYILDITTQIQIDTDGNMIGVPSAMFEVVLENKIYHIICFDENSDGIMSIGSISTKIGPRDEVKSINGIDSAEALNLPPLIDFRATVFNLLTSDKNTFELRRSPFVSTIPLEEKANVAGLLE